MCCAAFLCTLVLSAAEDSISLIQTSALGSDHAAQKAKASETFYPMTWHPNSMKTLKYNNLGKKNLADKDKQMRFENVSHLHTDAGNLALDLKITSKEHEYKGPKQNRNGLSGDFGTLWTTKDKAEEFFVELVYSETDTQAKVNEFTFTIFDIDDAPDEECTTAVEVFGATDGYYIVPDAYHDISVVYGGPWHNHTVEIRACSNVLRHVSLSNVESPTTLHEISGPQARAAITYHFSKTGEFGLGLHSKRLRGIFFIGADEPLKWDGVSWHEVFEPIQHPILLPGHGQLFRWNLDKEAVVTYNNLGGRGPNLVDPEQIRYSNVGELITHSNHSDVANGSNTSVIINSESIDLVVIVPKGEQYFGGKHINENWNGANGAIGEIGLSPGSSVTLQFTFVHHGTDIPAVPPAHDFVIFDIDNQRDTALGEEYIVYQAHEMYITDDSSIVLVEDSNSTYVHLRSHATTGNAFLEGAVPNPTSWAGLSEDQQNVAAHFRYFDTATWKVKFITTAELPRAFLFSGQSQPALPDIAQKQILPTPAPTSEPTPSPTSTPTVVRRRTPSPTVLDAKTNPTAAPASMYGDPHVKNVQGETFDINQVGSHTFLLIPRGAEEGRAQLSMRGVVTRHGVNCSGQLYLTRLLISGEWLGPVGSLELSTEGEGFDVPEAVGLKVGGSGNLSVEEFSSKLPPKMANVTLLHPVEPQELNKHVTTLLVRLYVGPTIIRLSWEHQKEKMGYSNSLMLLTYGLGNVTDEVGGLLGVDDHKWATSKPEGCDGEGQEMLISGKQASCCIRAEAMLGEP